MHEELHHKRETQHKEGKGNRASGKDMREGRVHEEKTPRGRANGIMIASGEENSIRG